MEDYFRSKNFDPVLALANSNVSVDIGEEYKDLYELQNKVNAEKLNIMTEDIEGVLGPGGIPIAKQPQHKIQGRRFHEEQGPIISTKPKKELRNVLLRMDNMVGPLATLKKCRDTNTRIKVHTRNHLGVRGIMTGYVLAFDKYWNLVLRDVDEIFRKKIQCKIPSFDDIKRYINVANLSIDSNEERSGDKMNQPCTWPKTPKQSKHFIGKTASSCDEIAVPIPLEGSHHRTRPTRSSHSIQDSESNSSKGVESTKNRIGEGRKEREERTKLNRERKKTEGFLIEKKTLHEDSSRFKDVKFLQDKGGRLEGREERNVLKKNRNERRTKEIEEEHTHVSDIEHTLQERERILQELQKLSDDEEETEVEEGEELQGVKKKNRTRRRKKYELRERHVNQLLVRGETIIIIQVLQL